MIYVIHKLTGKILFAKGGERATERAVAYAARRDAIIKAAAWRDGFAPTACEPVKIVSHSGRPLKAGAMLFERKMAKSSKQFFYKSRRKFSEVASVLPQAMDAEWRRLLQRYPRSLRGCF